MMRSDKAVLTGGWILILACALGGFTLIQKSLEPKPIPEIRDYRGPGVLSPDPGLEARKRLAGSLVVVSPRVFPQSDTVATLPTLIKVRENREPVQPPLVLPPLIYSGTVDMDRARLTWKLAPLSMNDKGVRSEPEGFLVHRQVDDGEIEQIAVLGAKVTSFEDLTVQGRHTYRYWVLARGAEGLKTREAAAPVVEKEGEGKVEGRTPEWIKVRLAGGDTTRAILNVETYNPLTGRWEGSVAQAAVGQPIGRTGWTLERTRFDRFTLVAELKDDRSEIRVVSTRKD